MALGAMLASRRDKPPLGPLAQLAEALVLGTKGSGFESPVGHNTT